MPLPTQLSFLFASGLVCALAARSELRATSGLLTPSRLLAAYAMYLVGVALPCSLYFYFFHGDWYLLYMVDVRQVRVGLVLCAALLQVLLGIGGFLIGAALVRRERERAVAGLIVTSLLLSVGVALLPGLRARIAKVGSYAQFHGDFGLVPISGTLLYGVLWMSLWMLIALGMLAYRVGPGARRA